LLIPYIIEHSLSQGLKGVGIQQHPMPCFCTSLFIPVMCLRAFLGVLGIKKAGIWAKLSCIHEYFTSNLNFSQYAHSSED